MGLYGNSTLCSDNDKAQTSEMAQILKRELDAEPKTIMSYFIRIKPLFDLFFASNINLDDGNAVCEAIKDGTLYHFNIALTDTGELIMTKYQEISELGAGEVPIEAAKYAIENCDKNYALNINRNNIVVESITSGETDMDLNKDITQLINGNRNINKTRCAHVTSRGIHIIKR